MYRYVNNNNQLITLTDDEIKIKIKENKNLVSLSIELNSTIKVARDLINKLPSLGIYEKYGNEQYNKWTIEEDLQLEKEYKSNMSIKEISQIHGRTDGAIRSRLRHKNLYIPNTEIKNISTKDENIMSGMFRIRFEEENYDEVYFYNIKEKEDNLQPSMPIFNELFNTEIGEKNSKYLFTMLDKSQYIPEEKVEKETVEKDIIPEKSISDLKIYFLTTYIPKWCNRNDENSNRLIDLKNRYNSAIAYYSELTFNWLEKNNLLDSNTIIAVIPGHSASLFNTNGTASIASNIINNRNVINGINLILRKKTIPKKSTSMYRPTLNTDINSLSINPNIDIMNKRIILLDDVTTNGDSFKAAAYHLYKLGAKEIIPLAMGKTVIPNE